MMSTVVICIWAFQYQLGSLPISHARILPQEVPQPSQEMAADQDMC